MPLTTRVWTVALVLFASTHIINVAASTCYNRNGNAVTKNIIDDPFFPCRTDTETTHCCAQRETCLSNGLCFVSNDGSLNTGACTDQGWGSPCTTFCYQYEFATFHGCGGQTWCCSNSGNTTSCCDDGPEPFKILGKFLVENGTAFVEGYEMVASAAIRDDNGNNTTTSTQPSETCEASGSSTSTLAVGFGTGLGVAIPLLATVAALIVLLRRERARSRAVAASSQHADPMPGPGHSDAFSSSGYTQVQERKAAQSELGSVYRAELSN